MGVIAYLIKKIEEMNPFKEKHFDFAELYKYAGAQSVITVKTEETDYYTD